MRGPHHYARKAALRARFARHHTWRKAYRFHRGGFFVGVLLGSLGAGQMIAWAVFAGVFLMVLCGLRGAYAFSRLPYPLR